MKLNDLKSKIDMYHHIADATDQLNVVIQVKGSDIGGTPFVDINMISKGFDWDSGKLFIVPTKPLCVTSHNSIERQFLVRAIGEGYKYICRCENGDIIISKEIPKRRTRSWEYKKTVSERSSLFKNDFKHLTWENGGVCGIKDILHFYEEN